MTIMRSIEIHPIKLKSVCLVFIMINDKNDTCPIPRIDLPFLLVLIALTKAAMCEGSLPVIRFLHLCTVAAAGGECNINNRLIGASESMRGQKIQLN